MKLRNNILTSITINFVAKKVNKHHSANRRFSNSYKANGLTVPVRVGKCLTTSFRYEKTQGFL